MKKLIAILLSMTLVIGTIAVYGASSSDGDKDGDICVNPWGELFTTVEGQTTTEDASEESTSSEEISSEESSESETTTEEPITEESTTVAQTTTSKNATEPKRTKVKSVSKKKAAKKVKVSIKKVKGAKGYRVQFSTTRKFKKVLVSKIVKRRNATIKNKKLKNKKKLYVRVKAYKLDGKKRVWAKKWSKVKKVKIKK